MSRPREDREARYMPRKKLMILGAGRGQVPIIKLARAMGHEAIVVSIRGNYPGISLADKHLEIDVRDKESVLAAAESEGIDGVIADQIDIAVPSVAFVAETLGLPGIGYERSLRFTDKYMMRLECERLGIASPRFMKATTIEEARAACDHTGLPVVVKPVDNAGSKGVGLASRLDELPRLFEEAINCSRKKAVIIEEFIEGAEYLVEGLVIEGVPHNLAIAERQDFRIPGRFIPNRTVYRPAENMVEARILQANLDLISGLELPMGATHSEFLVQKGSGKVYLVETAARGGGCYISSDLVPLATGIELNRHLIEMALGKAVGINPHDIRTNVCGFICFSLPAGLITSVSGREAVSRMPKVHKALLDNLEVGMEARPMMDKSMRQGPILIQADSIEDFNETVARIRETLAVAVQTQDGRAGIIW